MNASQPLAGRKRARPRREDNAETVEAARVAAVDVRQQIRDAAEVADVDVFDALDLAGMPLACEIADAWAHAAQRRMADYADLHGYAPGLPELLDKLEAVTRGSALRKVHP